MRQYGTLFKGSSCDICIHFLQAWLLGSLLEREEYYNDLPLLIWIFAGDSVNRCRVFVTNTEGLWVFGAGIRGL